MLRKAVAIGLVSILLMPMIISFTPVQTAQAADIYTSLTYNGKINFSYEEVLNTVQTVTGTAQFTFTITLNQPVSGSPNDIQGRATAQGTFSGTYPGDPYRSCPTMSLKATFTTDISGSTSVQADKVTLFGDGFLSNFVHSSSGPSYCYTDQRAEIGGILNDCFGGGRRVYTNQACREFPIRGGAQTITKGTSTAYKSISGTATLTLVDSKKQEPFDFSVEVTPPEVKVYKGGTATYAVSVSTVKGKATQVTLSAPNVEGLGRFALDRTIGTPPFNAKLTVPAGQANPGRYALQVVGTAGDVRKTTPVTLVVENCPKFTITPTMPVASDPREFAPSNGKASFRFDIEWSGKLPVSVGLNAAGAGGGGAIQSSFAFNPVRMLNNKVNIILDVTTSNAGKGDYPIAVTATINDPDLPRECSSATTNVVLVVGESRPQDFPLQPRPNPPQPQPINPPQPKPIKIADQQGNVTIKGNLVETGNNGKAKIPLGNTTLDVNNKTKVWRLNWADIIDDDIDDLIANELRRRPPGLRDILKNELKSIWEDIKLEVSLTWNDIAKPVTEIITCLFATSPEFLDMCSGKTAWYIDGAGDVHYLGSLPKRRAEVHVDYIMTRDAVLIPAGTEFIISLDKIGNTKVTVIEGSVLYIQLSTRKVMMINATQQLAVQVQTAGGNNLVSNRISSVDFRSLDQWWVQGGGATLKPLSVIIQQVHVDPKPDARSIPIHLEANVAGGQPPYVYLWDLGDGTVKIGERWMDYSYVKAGLFTVTLRVRDAVGQVISAQKDVRVEIFGDKPPPESQQQQPSVIASPSSPFGIGDEVAGTILGTLIVFMAVTGAFLRPSKRSRQRRNPETPQAGISRFRPRNMAFLGAFLIVGPFVIILPILRSEAKMIAEDLLISTLVIPWLSGFLLLLAAPIKLMIDKAKKKNS